MAVFVFDCSSAHEAYAADALMAHKMNRGPGGKQPKMHDTVIPATGEVQSMVFPENYSGVDKDGNSLAGRPKGMEQVLRERGILAKLNAKHGKKLVAVCKICQLSQAALEKAMKEAKSRQDEIEGTGLEALGNCSGASEMDSANLERAQDCCMQRALSLEKDFADEKPLLQLVIEKAGHKCLFLPKFHCELNPIEMVWGQAKRCESKLAFINCSSNILSDVREEADGTFPRAHQLVPKCLDHVDTANIRHYFQHCWRYMDAYR